MSNFSSQDAENQAYTLGANLEKEKLSRLEIIDGLRMKGLNEAQAGQVADDMMVERDRRNRKQGKRMMLRGAVVLLIGWGVTMATAMSALPVTVVAYGAIIYGAAYLLVGTWKLTA